MRAALCAFAVFIASISTSAALAQVGQSATRPDTVLRVQGQSILDGVWRVNGLGDLSVTTRPNDVLEGRLAGRACHGQYRGDAFALLCESVGRGPYIITGVATEEPPVAATARARVAARPARMNGEIHQSYLSSRGHVEQVATLSAMRQ